MQTGVTAPSTLDVTAVRFATRPFQTLRRVLSALNDSPRSAAAVAADLGIPMGTVRAALIRLVDAHLALRVKYGGYVVCAPMTPEMAGKAVPPEIGRQILACLTEPRRARDIARLVNRPGSVTTGHLRHLLKRRLVVRVSKGVYALAGHADTTVPSNPVVAEVMVNSRPTAGHGEASCAPVARAPRATDNSDDNGARRDGRCARSAFVLD